MTQIEDWLMRAGAWLVCLAARRTFERGEWDKARGLIRDEIMAAPRNVAVAMRWRDAEAKLISERLTRRYDPGMALSEAMARSVEAKKAAEREGHGADEQADRRHGVAQTENARAP